MSRKSYHQGFADTLYNIAGNSCEICNSNRILSIHHIIPRNVGKTINELWNGIVLCISCHKPFANSEKLSLVKLQLYYLTKYCIKWNQVPDPKSRKLISYSGDTVDYIDKYCQSKIFEASKLLGGENVGTCRET